MKDLHRMAQAARAAAWEMAATGLNARNAALMEMAKELGYKTVFWSLAYVDWKNDDQPDPDASLAKLLKRTHNGAVVLLHSTSQTNAKILDTLLTRWEEAGYTFGTLDDLFPGSNGVSQ